MARTSISLSLKFHYIVSSTHSFPSLNALHRFNCHSLIDLVWLGLSLQGCHRFRSQGYCKSLNPCRVIIIRRRCCIIIIKNTFRHIHFYRGLVPLSVHYTYQKYRHPTDVPPSLPVHLRWVLAVDYW